MVSFPGGGHLVNQLHCRVQIARIRFRPVDLAAAAKGNISTVLIFIAKGYVQETDLLNILYKK